MRADRLLTILMVLQARGRATAQELAVQLEVSERTIYRDLDALSAAGIPLYADRGPGGGYTLMEGYRSGLTALTEAETHSLLLATVAKPIADLGLEKSLRDALLKLLAALPVTRREEAERQWSLLHIDPGPWFADEETIPHLPLVQRAVWESRRLRIHYQDAEGGQRERDIAPYGLVVKADRWYVVAHTARGYRTYRVSRILDAQLLPETFTRPPDFDLAALWNRQMQDFVGSLATYTVEARFAPSLHPYLAQIYKERLSLPVEDAPRDSEGWCVLTVRYENAYHALEHLMSMGASVEILSPEDLRAALIREIESLQNLYKPAPVEQG